MPDEDYKQIRYDVPVEHVARITLARPDSRNAQDYLMLHELDNAFQRATTDDGIKVIVLAADGPHFSSGHDLTNTATGADFEPHCMTGGYAKPGQEGGMSNEEEFYLGMCWRWRNVPKPTIAQVQGKVIAGGLMLVWPMDIIVASDDATFADPVVAFAVNGHEYHTHTWEVGARKAKEMLFSGRPLSARECEKLGMINHVVPRDDLAEFTLRMAADMARMPSMGLKLAKLSVNGALEAQGQWTALRHAFALHQTGHANARAVHDGLPVDPTGIERIRDLSKG
ncbi:enoyl-CoA hydratase [Actinomadura madurae]|uniref:enoyl-CoA hydratase n=1 Tax=Actinomadura madurae TaxID=1993 RepID=UPI002025F690|nr:enoyl-CoA hydratase [Actinomadura madurae]MCP9949947.1 enoyl-CoA hydratase [Actinomadura madurae]MCP9966704.1 enoyl-CoA hydratase [Actinomadura madurae]MCP9979192.1 enoyl-CoA hydratase [Actinomadura madurae]MCQ0009281.1 enoyl-CoA hydratase [Actinomadura madurae]MCQ0015383.1 enoyl-CoA hydratase [Actinomadura madurae]